MNQPTETDCSQNNTTATPEKPIDEVKFSTVVLNLKISDFWQNDPRSWFHQFETYMSLQNQDDRNKYHLVISKLNKEALQVVSDIVFNPPRNGKYEALKTRLLNVFEVSEEKKIEKIKKELESSAQDTNRLMMSNLIEQNNLLRRIEQLLLQLCETFGSDTQSNCSSDKNGKSSSQGWMCWFHRRFGVDSTKCADNKRCSFSVY